VPKNILSKRDLARQKVRRIDNFNLAFRDARIQQWPTSMVVEMVIAETLTYKRFKELKREVKASMISHPNLA